MSIIGNFPANLCDEEQVAESIAAHNASDDAHQDIRSLAANAMQAAADAGDAAENMAESKQNKLSGKKGQVVGFSDTGMAVAQDNIPTVEVTQDEYDSLSETEKQSPSVYVVYNGQDSNSDGITIKYKDKSISAGSSPYEYAVAGGYKGTEEEFQALMGSGPWVPSTGRLLPNNNEVFNDLGANSAQGRDNHAEGSGCNISGCGASHIEGSSNNAHIYDANGTQEVTYDSGIHVEGIGNDIQSYDGFSLGIHVEGHLNVLKSSTSRSYEDVSEISGTHVEGTSNEVCCASHSHVEGRLNKLSAVSNSSLIPSVYSCHIGGESNVVVAHSVDG